MLFSSVIFDSILFVGDSFRLSIIPHLVNDFSNVYVVHRNDYKTEMIENYKPDVVVLEYVERYSNQLGFFRLFE